MRFWRAGYTASKGPCLKSTAFQSSSTMHAAGSCLHRDGLLFRPSGQEPPPERPKELKSRARFENPQFRLDVVSSQKERPSRVLCAKAFVILPNGVIREPRPLRTRALPARAPAGQRSAPAQNGSIAEDSPPAHGCCHPPVRKRSGSRKPHPDR